MCLVFKVSAAASATIRRSEIKIEQRFSPGKVGLLPENFAYPVQSQTDWRQAGFMV